MKILSKDRIKQNDKELINVKDERRFLEKTNNKFITNLKYAFQSNSYLFLVMELASGGNLI